MQRGIPFCQTNTEPKIIWRLNDAARAAEDVVRVKQSNNRAVLPIGRAAQVAFQIEALRAECCAAAHILTGEENLDESELDECAQLDDALAEAQTILKSAVGRIMLSRLKRRSRVQ